MSKHLLAVLRAPLRPYARAFATGTSSSQAAAARPAAPAPQPQPPQLSPAAFLAAIARPPWRPDLSGDAKLVALLSQQPAAGAAPEAAEAAQTLRLDVPPKALKEAGVTVQMRRYLLWTLSKMRAGEDPASFPQRKKPKRVRGWGPRVQKGIRVRGVRRAGEK